jgi:peptide/nickel transport system substrate-binding protein
VCRSIRRRRRSSSSSGDPASSAAPAATSSTAGDGTDVADTSGAGTAPGTDGPGGADPAAFDRDAELTFATVAVPSGIDPHKEAHGGERVATFQVYDRLTQVGPQLELEPMLATDWSYAPDGLSLTMTLRDDVTFQDGTPFNADAVVANIQRAKTIEGGTTADELEEVESVEALSPPRSASTCPNRSPTSPRSSRAPRVP